MFKKGEKTLLLHRPSFVPFGIVICRQSSSFGYVRNEHPTAEESHIHAGDELPTRLPPGGTRRS